MINEEIKTHINERIEALKLELESKYIRVTKETEFEDGVWYKHSNSNTFALHISEEIAKGFITNHWVEDLKIHGRSSWQKVTDFTELEELLKKEAVKSGMIDGAIINQSTMKNNWVTKHILGSNYFEFKSSTNILYCDGKAVFYKGTWAEVVKEKTTEDWLNCASLYWRRNQADNCVEDNFIDFFKQNKLKIIQEK